MTSEQRTSATAAGEGRRGPPVRYLPGEVCLVVETPPGVADGSYEVVRRQVNEAIRGFAPDDYAVAKGVFARDLTPAGLRKHVSAGVDVLTPLEIPGGGDGGQPARTVALPTRKADDRVVALHYFRLPDAGDPNLVKQIVNQINLNRDRLGGALPGQGIRILAATPNWLAAGAEDFTECGPGARPEPAPAGRWDLHFANGKLAEQLANGTGKDVVVAILDTCPAPQVVAEAAAQRGNRLLAEVANTVKLESPPSLSQAYFAARLPETVAGWQRVRPAGRASLDRFLMPDHGLFAAGLVRDLVPDAEIHLLRVMSDFGVGDLLGVSWVLSRLPQTFLMDARGQPNGKRLVVNLSLMFDVPPGVSVRSPTRLGDVPPSNAFLRYWFPEASRSRSGKELHRQLQRPENTAIAGAIKDTHLGLQILVSSLTTMAGGAPDGQPVDDGELQRRQILVAAAGNDNRPGQPPPSPRLPARYDNVLGVAAVNRKLAPAKYSNLGDETVIGNGVAVFGGDAGPGPNPDDPNLIDTGVPPGTVDAVVGVFSAPTFPRVALTPPGVAPPPQNTTGWAYWAGTSFATPIVSGIAASVWSSDPGTGPREVLETVRTFATAGQQLASPVIEASQVR